MSLAAAAAPPNPLSFKARKHFNVTVLLIEHDMKLVGGICEELTVLNFGETLATGETKDVLSRPEVVKAYLGDE